MHSHDKRPRSTYSSPISYQNYKSYQIKVQPNCEEKSFLLTFKWSFFHRLLRGISLAFCTVWKKLSERSVEQVSFFWLMFVGLAAWFTDISEHLALGLVPKQCVNFANQRKAGLRFTVRLYKLTQNSTAYSGERFYMCNRHFFFYLKNDGNHTAEKNPRGKQVCNELLICIRCLNATFQNLSGNLVCHFIIVIKKKKKERNPPHTLPKNTRFFFLYLLICEGDEARCTIIESGYKTWNCLKCSFTKTGKEMLLYKKSTPFKSIKKCSYWCWLAYSQAVPVSWTFHELAWGSKNSVVYHSSLSRWCIWRPLPRVSQRCRIFQLEYLF